ncbi:MAG TPA: hypothetical protein VJV79_31665 [Polyangiaceae bacterium]|nr:hypothetical protein [Polyangiaceae bacterium]
MDSKTARRSYEIASAYRARGVKVVLGGIHPTAVGPPYFTPTGMSREELREGWQRAWQRF